MRKFFITYLHPSSALTCFPYFGSPGYATATCNCRLNSLHVSIGNFKCMVASVLCIRLHSAMAYPLLTNGSFRSPVCLSLIISASFSSYSSGFTYSIYSTENKTAQFVLKMVGGLIFGHFCICLVKNQCFIRFC